MNIPPNTTINFNGTVIYPSKHVKNLGIYIDRYMLFDVHIHELNNKAMGILLYISRIVNSLDKQTRVIVVQTLVLSLMEYCIRIVASLNFSSPVFFLLVFFFFTYVYCCFCCQCCCFCSIYHHLPLLPRV